MNALSALRALLGGAVLLLLWIVALAALVVACIIAIFAGIVAIVLCAGIVIFMMLVMAICSCLAAAIFIIFFPPSLVELPFALYRRKPVWSCQAGKRCLSAVSRPAGIFGDVLCGLFELCSDGFDSLFDCLEKPFDGLRDLDDQFGTTEFLREIIDKLNSICRGEYQSTSLP